MTIAFIRKIQEFCCIPICFIVLATALNGHDSDRSEIQNSKTNDLIIRHEVQANTFTASSQSESVIANHPDGGFTVVWHSRRQQAGTYGVYLQRFAANGEAIGSEQQVNVFTQGMQMKPAIATDSTGTTWVAWESFGQDGSFNAIIARRFDSKNFTGGDEILVNQFTTGNQSEVVVATGEDGTAAFFWVTQSSDGKMKQIAGRRFDNTGNAIGDQFIVANSSYHQDLPAVSSNSGKTAVVWAEQDNFGRPVGIFGAVLNDCNRLTTKPFAVSPKDQASHIEPSISAIDSDGFAVTWLRSKGSEHEVLVRRFQINGEAACAPIQASVPGEKYVSGVSVDSNSEGQTVVVWNQQTDKFGRDINIFGQLFDEVGSRVGSVFPINAIHNGRHRLASASGKNRVAWGPKKEIRVAWSGKNKTDDSSVNVTAIVPRGMEFAFVSPPLNKDNDDSISQLTAKPHEPPTYDPRLIAKEPFGGFDVFGPEGTDFGFVAINATGWNPPDPVIAAGPNHLVAMTNGAIVFYDKSGTLTFSDQIEGAGGFWGSEGATGFVFDPEALFDPHSQRFFAMANERGNGRSYFLIAVSDDDDPNGNWFKYRLDVTDLGGNDIDSPNMAIDSDVLYLTADFFGPDRYLVYMLRKSDLLVGDPVVATDLLINGSQSYGLPVIYDQNAPAFYMLQAFEFGSFSSVRIHAITDPLTNPQRVFTNVTVPAYGHPQDPPQQGTSVRPELFEARFWSCVYRNGSLWAVHHHSPNSQGTVRARWYEFAMNEWPTSGQSPQLVQSGELTPLNDNGQISATFFPSIWVDGIGNAAITTARSSAIEFISMSRATRSATDAPGTFQDVQLVRPSTAAFTSGGRWGDYSGTSSDPVEPGAFWGIHEFAQSAGVWQTYIAKYVVGSETTTIFPGSVATSTGAITGGDASSLHESDDQLLVVQAEFPDEIDGEEIIAQIVGNSVNTNFELLSLLVETNSNTPNVVQNIELFNFLTQQFEIVDSQSISNEVTTIELEISGDVTRFVTPNAGVLLAQISFESSGPNLFFPWQVSIDRFVWQISD